MISSDFDKIDFCKFLVDFLLSCPVIALRVLLSVYNFARFGTFAGPKSAENALRRVSRVYI